MAWIFKLLMTLTMIPFVASARGLEGESERLLPPPVSDQEKTKAIELEEVKPLWEAGFATISIWTPDYPGAEQGKFRHIPAPFFYYRGPVLRADEGGGLRGRFVHQSRWEMDLSIGAAFPADSEDNKARRGMEDLDWIFEFGPKAIYYILPRLSENKFVFELPFHIVSSTDFGRVDGRGYRTEPEVSYEDKIFLHPSLATRYFASVMFGSRQLNEYFYEVSPENALPDRAIYRARGGFMGSKIGFRISWQATRNLRFIAGYTGTSYEGAINEDSPLMKDRWTHAGAIGFLWKFYESDARGYQ